MLGVPHDSDPHFSPEGDRLVFRSDAELGVENIWVTPWNGCNVAALRPDLDLEQHEVSLGLELKNALAAQTEDEILLSSGIKETSSRKRRRLLREGRLHGILSLYSVVLCVMLFQLIESPMRHIDSSLMLGFIPLGHL